MNIKQRIKDIWEKRDNLKRFFVLEEREGFSPDFLDGVQERLLRCKDSKILRFLAAAAGCALLVWLVKYTIENWQYQTYKVVTETVQEDTVSVQYTEFGDNILKYGGDEVSLQNRQGETVWNEPQTMDNPTVDICDEYCVVYDKKGTVLTIFNLEGKAGSIQTSLPILKAKVASQGVTAVVLEDGETTWINVYNVKGEEIVTAKTRVDSPGYPVDISISGDGLLLAVSYLKVENNKPASYVAFYNFGNTGQNQMDNMVSGYTYSDVIVPDVEYLNNSCAVAFRDDGFVIFKGKQIPEETVTVKTENEILAVFCNDDGIGLVFRDTESDSPYRMELYDSSGKLKYTTGLDISFDHIDISKDQIILYNNNEFAVYTLKAKCRYEGTLKEGNIQSIFKVAKNRYMAVLDGGVETIKLK
ncbi:MAG: DUF5711 family protein [Oliverpabstia sp.]